MCVLAMVAMTLGAIVHDRVTMELELNALNVTLEEQVHYDSPVSIPYSS